MRRKVTAVLAATLIAGSGAFCGIASADPSTPAPTPTPMGPPPGPAPGPTGTASADAPAQTGPKTTIDQAGTYAVGTDIVPGTYSSAGPTEDGTCYWKRVGGNGDTVDNALSKKAQVVQIDATDKSFKTNGCQAWQLTPGAEPPPSTLTPAQAALQLGGLILQAPHP